MDQDLVFGLYPGQTLREGNVTDLTYFMGVGDAISLIPNSADFGGVDVQNCNFWSYDT